MIRDLRYYARHAALLVLQVALMLVLCGFVVALGDRYNRRYDLTPQQAFILSDQAKSIAASIAEPVHIAVFYNERDNQRREVADLIEQFAAVNRRISYDLYDLDRTPGLAKRYKISNYNTGVVESGHRSAILPGIQEADVAAALLKVSRERPRTLCFLIGHGEQNPRTTSDRGGYSEVAKALEVENFLIRTLETVPSPVELATCTVVIMAGPSREFFGDEGERLSEYLENGGRVFALLDPETPASIAAFVRRFGVATGDDLLVDERNRLYGADAFMARVPIFDKGTFGRDLDLAAVFALAQSLEPATEAPSGLEVTPVALSAPDSWARTDGGTPAEEAIPRFRPGTDQNGPLPVGVLVTIGHAAGDGGHQTGRLAVFGDADFASNFYLNLLGNKDLFMSMIAVLSEEPALVAVRRKGLPKGSLSPILLTARQSVVVFWTSVVSIPGLVLFVGTVVAVRRRRRGSSR